MDGDTTPEMVLSEDEENAAPVGDIAELTARVSECAATPGNFAEPPSSARTRVSHHRKIKVSGRGVQDLLDHHLRGRFLPLPLYPRPLSMIHLLRMSSQKIMKMKTKMLQQHK